MTVDDASGAKVDIPQPRLHVTERAAFAPSGALPLLIATVLVLGGIGSLITADRTGGKPVLVPLGLLLIVLGAIAVRGLISVAPGESRVLQFFGRYSGTVRDDGFHFINPLSSRRKVSTRVRNHETDVLRVNDFDGNPVEIAAVVVWQVTDTARAVFEVDDFIRFVAIQTETAVRHTANSYPYDNHELEGLSLRENADEITQRLSDEITERVAAAGVSVIESRITHLAYAPEIAGAMLQRQQAGAVVAARNRIVDGAVGMVQLALTRLADEGIVELDEERKAAMVSNLLVVLCGDRATQPVVNAGSLY